jgi:hypothetical protein
MGRGDLTSQGRPSLHPGPSFPLLVWMGVTLVPKCLVGMAQAKPGTRDRSSLTRETTTHMISITFENLPKNPDELLIVARLSLPG